MTGKQGGSDCHQCWHDPAQVSAIGPPQTDLLSCDGEFGDVDEYNAHTHCPCGADDSKCWNQCAHGKNADDHLVYRYPNGSPLKAAHVHNVSDRAEGEIHELGRQKDLQGYRAFDRELRTKESQQRRSENKRENEQR